MALGIRKNLISLFCRLKHSNSSPLCKTHYAFSTSAAAAEKTRLADFSPDTAFKLISLETRYVKDSETCDPVLSFFKDFGFSTTQIEKMVKRSPQVISANLDLTIKPKLKILEEVGGLSPNEIAEIISINPSILKRGTNVIEHSLGELKRVVGGSSVGLFRVLKACAWFLKYNLELTMMPNMNFLKTCGVADSDIVRFMPHFPRIFLLKPELMKKCVERVDHMGVQRDSKMFLYAIRSVGSMSVDNWERKLELFRSLGFWEDDIISAFRRVPQAFALSERKIKEATKFLLSAGNDDISLIVNNPELLIYSVEKRLKPRIKVMEVLETKDLLVKKKPSFITMCKMSNEDFMKKYVLPYSAELGTIYPHKGDSTET